MVNYHDPSVILADLRALTRFLHVGDGVYIWDCFSTLWFEWSFVKGEQPYRWSIWVYASTRLATLLNVLTNLIGFNVRKSINCQLWLYSEFITAYTAFALGSLLMLLRIVAIWSTNKWVLGASIGTWLTNLAFLIRSVVITSAHWDHTLGMCVLDESQRSRDNTTATFCAEAFLLLVMLAGLMRQRDHYLGRLLFNQGLIWLIAATIAEVPPFVLLFLNLNGPWNLMFQTSSLLIMTMCVTRMYRGLSASRDHQHEPKTLNLDSSAPQGTVIRPMSIRLNNLDVGLQSRYTSGSDTAEELQAISMAKFQPNIV